MSSFDLSVWCGLSSFGIFCLWLPPGDYGDQPSHWPHHDTNGTVESALDNCCGIQRAATSKHSSPRLQDASG